MPNTHYVHVVGEAHQGSEDLGLVDSVLGGTLRVYITNGIPLEVNSIARGSISGTVVRVVKLTGADSFHFESIGSSIGTPPGQPGGAFAGAAPPFVAEEIVFDNGTLAVASPVAHEQSQRLRQQYMRQKRDATLNSWTPDDPQSDAVFWDQFAKIASNLRISIASVVPALPAISFVKGDRCTTSSGGAFTIQLVTVVGSEYHFKMIKKSGAILPGDVITNQTGARAGNTASIVNEPSAVEPDNPVGCWVAHHVMPNVGALGTYYEYLPWGDGGGVGIYQPIVRGLWKRYQNEVDVTNRGVRVMPFRTFDHFTGTDGPERALRGGVSIQGVECSGTFPTNWARGETVTGGGGWSAKVWHYDAPKKVLWVYDTNGAVLTAGTVTGVVSGASATNIGECIGWQPGSYHWNRWMETYDAAKASNHPLSQGLYMGQPAALEGIVFTIWEAELAPFSTGYHTDFVGQDHMIAQWSKFITAVREHFGNPTLPIALFQHVVQSHASDSYLVPGLPIAYFLREVLSQISARFSYVNLVGTHDMEPSSELPLPVPLDCLRLRPDDYYEVGRRAWRALTYGSVQIPTGNFEPIWLMLVAGQSFAKSSIPSGWGFQDNDPELFPALNFPGADTTSPTCLNYDWLAREWRVYDIELCANTFLDRQGFGFEAPIMARASKRWADELNVDGPVGLIKFAVNGASAYGGAVSCPFTFDPAGAARSVTTFVGRVTVVGGRGRFTSAPGTFSALKLSEFTSVSGSLLGYQGLGGNNSPEWSGGFSYAIAPDGSYIDIAGSFAAEVGDGTGYLVNNGSGYAPGASVVALDTGTGTMLAGDRVVFGNHGTTYTVMSALAGGFVTLAPALTASVPNNTPLTIQARLFTLLQGPISLAQEIETHLRIAFEQCVVQLRRIPRPGPIIWWNGEADLKTVAAYKQALRNVLDWFEERFGQKLAGEARSKVVVMSLSPNTPWDVDDEDVDLMIAQQREVAAEVGGVFVDMEDLPHNFDSGIFPRLTRRDNGVHATYQGYIWAGRKVDAAMYLAGIVPAHPKGESAAAVASLGGSVAPTSGAGGGDEETLRADEGDTLTGEVEEVVRAIGTPEPINYPVVVETGSGIANATSYLSLSEWRDMVAQIGNPTELATASDEQVQYWLRLAAQHGIDYIFSRVWTGLRAHEGQGLDWPRTGAGDNRVQRVIASTVVPAGVRWGQFWYSVALALGIDPMRDYDPDDEDQRKRYATSISETLPGGLSESITFAESIPRRAVLPRMHAAVAPFLIEDDDYAGMA